MSQSLICWFSPDSWPFAEVMRLVSVPVYWFEMLSAAVDTRPAIDWNTATVPVGSLAMAAENTDWSNVTVPSFVRVKPIADGDVPLTGLVAAASRSVLIWRTARSPVNTPAVVPVVLPVELDFVVTAVCEAMFENSAARPAASEDAALVALLASGVMVRVAGSVVIVDTVTSTPVRRSENVLEAEVTV